jgi:hypothetical protein
MRQFLLVTFFAAVVLGLVAAIWWYMGRASVGSQLAGYRIGQAKRLSEAKREIAAIERQPNHDEALRQLVSGWRMGNQSFDFYLAAYLSDRQSSEDLRRLFSLELSWRSELLADWAHYWSWRSKQAPPDEIASIADYLAALSSADSQRRLTWREVLDFQAALALTDHADLARRLGPENWTERYRAWRESVPDVTQPRRPDLPLPGWQGPAPEMSDER